ncbi:predicted protein [Naegleria gruberi]|uniref:Predicted protein n=1 Tax=Naegleria gruberi TaxID=5762 RepID=D2VQR8_NAEGR|nr:uncharacterized protein NAEGRDRAFT_71323 [Naegleria gruberi]EFC40752.1 predicted protein [Naegleria gruberi]|eukprot:XP_002673496.1 predicted protein [Naegleria gruberi strain NEG-M]
MKKSSQQGKKKTTTSQTTPKTSTTSNSLEETKFIQAENDIALLYVQCSLFWKKFGKEFTNWWTNQIKDERKRILLEISPDMKMEAPLDTYDHEFTDDLLPEFFWKELSENEKSLISLCSIYFTLSKDKIEEMEYKRLYAAQDTIFKKLQMPYGKFTCYHEGKFYQIKKGASEQEIKSFLAISTVCDANTIFLVHQRLAFLYTTLTLACDAFFVSKGEDGEKLRSELEMEYQTLLKSATTSNKTPSPTTTTITGSSSSSSSSTTDVKNK